MSPLSVGDTVRIRTLRKVGQVIEVLGSDRYKVTLGSISITCSGKELERSEVKNTSSSSANFKSSQPAVISARRSAPRSSLDLHGKTVADAVSELEKWLDSAILAGLDRITVIHGHGTGRVQTAVHNYLRSIRAVKSFQVNQHNLGETIIYL